MRIPHACVVYDVFPLGRLNELSLFAIFQQMTALTRQCSERLLLNEPKSHYHFPHSQRVLTDLLVDCTPEERYEMTVKNVVELYDLPFVLEGPGQARLNQNDVAI